MARTKQLLPDEDLRCAERPSCPVCNDKGYHPMGRDLVVCDCPAGERLLGPVEQRWSEHGGSHE